MNHHYINMKRIITLIILAFSLMCCSTAQNATYTSLDNSEFAKVIKQKKTQIVDVRSTTEYAEGHLPNAINIDVNNKSFEVIAEKQLKKKKPVAVYCRSGKRSKIAAGKLAAKGFKVYELDKGIVKWDGEIEK